MKALTFAAAALVLAACAPSNAGTAPAPQSSPAMQTAAPAPTAAAMNPVGKFDFSTTVNGQTVTGTVEITGTAGMYTGSVSSSMNAPFPITRVTVNGQEMNVVANAGDGDLAMKLTFSDANAFTGSWSLAASGMSGTVTGRRQ